ncbi:Chitin binding Peritrophin-A domain containing protein [Brugia malayi]|uniref:Chitin binding Peritrophin-A domain containing protein n=1 Tax=Brugia malayi TaxID=6279 RepID=A0A4E9EP47_BRUMA|nr:Chitin binding Peritrophin-A domain containing protein [Brugia malayi]VIO85929.1 Chitin binding Peritrophin-A domain containing protein [Brugia malayi]
MNLQHPALLIVLIALTCCCVICTTVERIQNPAYFDGSYGKVRKGWRAKYRGHWKRLIDQSGMKEGEIDVVRLSTNRASKMMTSNNTPYDISDQVSKLGLKSDDMSKTLSVEDVRQLLFEPIRSKEADGIVQPHKLSTPKHWHRQIRQYEEGRKNILAVSKPKERYPFEKGQKFGPSKCSGQKDGIYEAGPCERWHLLCRNGKAKKIFCANGLYWNGDKNQCEPKINIVYCQLKFDCTGMDDGIYVDGCSNVFWFCNSETAFLSKCPRDLYFNINKLRCDLKEMIPACGGIDRDEMKLVNSQEKFSRKSREEWKEQVTHKLLESVRKEGICEERKDGKYAIAKCYEKFLFCVEGKSLIVNCHSGQLYSSEHQQCIDARNLPFCRDFADLETSTASRYSVSCSSLPDGTYELGDCERSFSICRNGVRSNASCGRGLVYNAQTGHCDYASNVKKCPQIKKEHEPELAHIGSIHKTMVPYRKQNVCQKWENGMYAIAKCYGKYLFCIDGRGLVVVCSDGQLFSSEHQQCMDIGKLPSCADFENSDTTVIAEYSDQCSSLSDGVYELGDCERNFLICFNGEGSIASCEPNFVYNGQTGHCEYKSKVEKCLRYRKNKQRRDKSALSHKEPDCRCKGQKDGLYAIGCTKKFYSCSNGISTGHKCPTDLVFNVDSGFCDYPMNVVACGGQGLMINDEVDIDEERTASNLISGCSILEDGIYGLSPCGSGYYRCWRGATSFARCAFDLVFNPSLNRCDFRENVAGCLQYNKTSNKIKKPIYGITIKPVEGSTSKCEKLSDGFYVEGCNRIYYICANGKTFYMNCPWNLTFNYRSGTCDERSIVEACRDTSSEKMHPSLFGTIAPLMPSCTTLPNGPYQFGLCLADYILCRDGVISLASCPDPMVFNPDNSRCALRSDVVACGIVNHSTRNKLDIYCVARQDGIFSYNCSQNFYICAKGKIYLFACPYGMVYDSKFRRCGNSAEVQSCIQTESLVSLLPREPMNNSFGMIVKDNDKFCDGRPDANYAAGLCSTIFFSCVHMRKVLMSCPEKLVYDESTNRCEEPKNVAECRNSSVIPKNISSDEQDIEERLISSTITPLCLGRKDNIYPLDFCLQSYLQCYNQKGIIKHCPDNMLFDGNVAACVPKATCNRIITSSNEKHENAGNDDSRIKILTETALPRCYEMADGDYSAGCVPDFITCIGGSEIHKKCPNSMVFSNILRGCVSYEKCAFLMYRVLASFHPSHRVGTHKELEKDGSAMNTPSVSDPELSVPEANTLVSGADVNYCEYARVQCTNELATNGQMDQMPIEKQPETVVESQFQEENGDLLCVPEVSGSRIDSVRCDNLDDGLYALDCSDKVAICSAGWKRIYGCPQGQFFIPALGKCDESWKCIDTNPCGTGFIGVVYLGKVESIKPSFSSSSVGDLSCVNRDDGNYGRQCSPIFVKCLHKIPILMRCQTGRLFDQRSSRCIPLDRCPMLSTTLDIGKVRCVENERFEIGICNDYYYACSNGKFVLYKCPPGYTFDAIHGVCNSKCNKPGCSPGEISSLGPCKNTYLKCNAKRTFEVGYCMEDKLFDSASRICRFRYEIAECVGNPMKQLGIISAPALHRVHDSFRQPLQFNPYLTLNRQNRNPYRLKLRSPYAQSAKIAPYQNPNMLSGILRAPSSNVFIPQMAQEQHSSHVFRNLPRQMRNVKDTFRVVPFPLGSIPNIQNLGIIDQFQLPSNFPTYSFVASRPSPSYNSPSTSSSNHGTTNRNGAVDSVEGSGEGDNASAVTDGGRVKRDASFETEFMEFGTGLERKLETDSDMELENDYFENEPDLCPSKTYSTNLTLGVCRPSYIFCNVKENSVYVADCNDGKLFDSGLKECLPAADCILRALHGQSNDNERTPCALLPDGAYSLPGCSQYFLSCLSNKAILRSCANGLYYDGSKHQCDYRERVAICNSEKKAIYEQSLLDVKDYSSHENIDDIKIALANANHEVPSTLPNFTCSINSTISLVCSPSFVICAGGIAYIFNCDGGLVFDQITSSCSRIEDASECDEQGNRQKMFSVTNRFSSSSSLAGFDDLPHTLVNLTNVSYDVSSFDCINVRNGLYASQCSPLFFVCSADHLTGFVCQDALVLNLETGFCDQKEYVASCKGTDLVNSSSTTLSSIAGKVSLESTSITAQPSYHSIPLKRWKCEDGFIGIMSKGCSRKFVLCVNSNQHLFFCQEGLVYNINTNRCDHAQNVAACGGKTGIPFKKRAYETSHSEKDLISTIHAVDLRTSNASNQTIQALCRISRGQSAAYGHCRTDFIFCPRSGNGSPHKSYCISDYLFDEDVGRCVPAEVCGMVGDAIAESVSLTKEKCDGVEDGTSKGIGLCLSEYYVCKKGVPIRRRCFKHLETFSATAGACMSLSLNPECQQGLVTLTDSIKKFNDTDDFCIHRPNGFYRHPTDCARILQCFGEEIFEHLPCDDGLVFNEISGGCDYKSNVPECAITSEKSEEGNSSLAAGSNCEGKSHGDHLADEKDCSVFYRCVWGKLEKFFCPEHTVFNPALSVCDFPSAVPYCKVTM